ncbi:hypothetical protein [Agathobacter sp.]
MRVFKDFTQEAYNDIQSYMGGAEQWEEINKTYGVVESKGIFQYDYETQLRRSAEEYQRQNEEAGHSVRMMFDEVNGVDDLYAGLFRDEYMDMDRFSTAIKELAALINVRSVDNIYTMDCETLKTKVATIGENVDSKIIEYYKSQFYSVDPNGKTVMNWEKINYEMRKENISENEIIAISSVFWKLYSDNDEETVANIENMLRAGYGKANDEEWIDNADLEDPKYYSVGVTDTFKKAVDLFKAETDLVNYYELKNLLDSGAISEGEYERIKEMCRESSLFKTIVDNYPTLAVAYNGEKDGFTIHSDGEGNISTSVCLKHLPFDVKVSNITDSQGRVIVDKYYDIKVTNGEAQKEVKKENETVSQIDIYGMVDHQRVGHVLPHSMIDQSTQYLEDNREEVKTVCKVFVDETCNTVKDHTMEKAVEFIGDIAGKPFGDVVDKIYDGIDHGTDFKDAYDENKENIEKNARIDEAQSKLSKMDVDAQDMIEYANYFCMDMEITMVDGNYVCENITTDVDAVTKMVNAYNEQADVGQEVSIKDLEDYARKAGNSQKDEDERYKKLCKRVLNYMDFVSEN